MGGGAQPRGMISTAGCDASRLFPNRPEMKTAKPECQDGNVTLRCGRHVRGDLNPNPRPGRMQPAVAKTGVCHEESDEETFLLQIKRPRLNSDVQSCLHAVKRKRNEGWRGEGGGGRVGGWEGLAELSV